MTIPCRGHTGQGTYFVTASTYLKENLLQSERMVRLFLDVLQHYRTQGKYLLHEFVIMPNHFHLLITPGHDTTLERALQLIKGGFSFRAKKELGVRGEIWQKSFYDRRVRDGSSLTDPTTVISMWLDAGVMIRTELSSGLKPLLAPTIPHVAGRNSLSPGSGSRLR